MSVTLQRNEANGDGASPFVELDRQTWSRLAAQMEQPLNEEDIFRLRGLGDPLDMKEVREVYLPLSRLLHLYVEAAHQLHAATTTFLGEQTQRTPFVIGVAGSVAVGKSTIARVLREMLRRWPGTPNVELITTDGFLYPLAELKRRHLLERKGFPESYDRRGAPPLCVGRSRAAPKKSAHRGTPTSRTTSCRARKWWSAGPDVLIVEGLNVLAPARPRQDGKQGLAVSDFFDFSIYVDAKTSYIEEWYVDRFRKLRTTAFAQPESYFHRYATLSDDEAETTARGIWKRINEPNLEENVLPTRGTGAAGTHQGSGPLDPPHAAAEGLASVPQLLSADR